MLSLFLCSTSLSLPQQERKVFELPLYFQSSTCSFRHQTVTVHRDDLIGPVPFDPVACIVIACFPTQPEVVDWTRVMAPCQVLEKIR